MRESAPVLKVRPDMRATLSRVSPVGPSSNRVPHGPRMTDFPCCSTHGSTLGAGNNVALACSIVGSMRRAPEVLPTPPSHLRKRG